jgi:proteasome lid subunit RPN8/RPN11
MLSLSKHELVEAWRHHNRKTPQLCCGVCFCQGVGNGEGEAEGTTMPRMIVSNCAGTF